MPEPKTPFKHPWFKRKGYLHFDKALELADAEIYITNHNNVIRHRFSPLIHYGKISRKVERDKAAEAAYKKSGKIGAKPQLRIKNKARNIFYASHVDGYIYSYYTHQIQKLYETFLEKHHLTENVIAYRPVSKGGIKFCNSHFAREAFDFVRDSGGCHVLCFDISKFFDNLSTKVLKEKWAQVLCKVRLPDDHFKVYESLVNFSYVEEGHLIESFKARFNKNPRQHGLAKDAGGSLRNRICDYPELRQLDKQFKAVKRRLINKKDMLGITGIPQGTAISGLLSNIFMIDFDLAVKNKIEGDAGFYRRYSDDIFIAIPTSISFEKIEEFIKGQLQEACGDSIKLNDKKTEKRAYRKAFSVGGEVVNADDTKAKMQYLGFHFDGQNVYIRNSSISKDRGKTVQALRKYKKGKVKIDTVGVYKERSARQLTPYDNPKKKGFVYYAQRAAEAHGGADTIKEQIKKNDRFIKRAEKRERQKQTSNG